MRLFLLPLVAIAILAAAPAAAEQKKQEEAYPPTAGIDTCATLDACMALIGAMQPPMDQGYWPREVDADVVWLHARFGQAAKQALMEKLIGPHGGWRNYAAAAISLWPDLNPGDLPALAKSLDLKAGGWSARAVARIGGPKAIEALIANPRDMSQTSFALTKLAPQSLPYLLPLLEQDRTSQGRRMAATVIRESEDKALSVAPEWAALALDTSQPVARRLAALRGLAAMGDGARNQGESLRPLRDDPSLAVRDEAKLTLAELRDPSVSREIADACKPIGEQLAGYAHHIPCLYDLGAQYRDAEVVGPALMTFLDSPDGAEASGAATILGFMDWEPALPDLETLLASRDWRVAYAAARSLGWMGHDRSVPALDKAADAYWFPAVRRIAREGAAAIRRGDAPKPPASFDGIDNMPGLRWILSVDHRVFEDEPGCSGDETWKGRAIRWTSKMKLTVPGGLLEGSNDGEWGGALRWRPGHGEDVVLLDQNVGGIVRSDRGAMVAFGLGHLTSSDGFVAEASRDGSNAWTLREIVRLPSAPGRLGVVSPGVFAIETDYGVIVFDREGPLGCGGG